MANIENDTAGRKKQANHLYLDSTGAEVESIESAVGYRYQAVGPDGEPNGQVFDLVGLDGAVAGKPLTMLALFGAKTVATNQASRNRNGPNKGEFATDILAIEARFEALKDGEWGVAEGGGGFALNAERLTDALEAVQVAGGYSFNRAKVLAAMQDGGNIGGKALDAKDYKRAVYAVAGVKDKYAELAGKAPTDAGSVASDFE